MANIYFVEQIEKLKNTQCEIDKIWVCARPMRLCGFWGVIQKIRCIWMVLTDKADLITWYKQ